MIKKIIKFIKLDYGSTKLNKIFSVSCSILIILIVINTAIKIALIHPEPEKAYQSHGWAGTVQFTDGRMTGMFYVPVTLTQREIDSLNNYKTYDDMYITDTTNNNFLIYTIDSSKVFNDTLIIIK